MNPSSPLFAIIVLVISFITCYSIKTVLNIPIPTGRFETIDGLRGLLALSVFAYHANVWYNYLHTGKWTTPVANINTILGETSLSMFFMITSFLFISKIRNAKPDGAYWRNLFISRFFRIAPMYYVSLIIMIIIVFIVSHFQRTTSYRELFNSLAQWFAFTIYGLPDINNVKQTWIINAGIAWTLPYEWLFYFSLPIISLLLIKFRQGFIHILISIIFISLFIWLHGVHIPFVLPFIGGAIPALLHSNDFVVKQARKKIASVMVLICLLLIVQRNTAFTPRITLLATVVFTCIALGNSMFGLLKTSTLKIIGLVSYSIYLLHGLLLFSFFNFVAGVDNVRKTNDIKYSLLIFFLTPVLVCISLLGFQFVERPFMERGKKIV